MQTQIQIATTQDFDNFWPIFQQIAQSGETYSYPTDITKQQAQIEPQSAPMSPRSTAKS
jgi:hypothetical protein